MRIYRATIGCTVILALVGACQSGNAGRLEIEVLDDAWPDSVRQNARTVDGVDADEIGASVTLAGAIGETLGFCLKLTPPGGLGTLSVDVTDLISSVPETDSAARIPAGMIRFYRVHEVSVERWPGWHLRSVSPTDRVQRVPDVLVPVDAPQGGLADVGWSSRPLRVWVDVEIPKGTAPGAYDGRLTFSRGGRAAGATNLSLTVWPFVLPVDRGLVVIGDLDHEVLFDQHAGSEIRGHSTTRHWPDDRPGQILDELLITTARTLRDHGVTPLLPDLAPAAEIDARGQLALDWTDYDRIVGGLLDGRAFFDRQPLPAWRVPFSETFPPPPEYGATSSPTYARLAREHLTQCAAHFEARGWLDRSFVSLPFVDWRADDRYATAEHLARVIHGADPRLRTLAPLFPQDISAYGWEGFTWQDIAEHVDIWAPLAQFYDPAEMRQQRLRERQTFWRLDRPPFSGSIDLVAQPAATRAIAWQARANGVQGVLLGSVNAWPTPRSGSLTPRSCCTADYAPLLYPGRAFGLDGPVASARLKRLRRSVQDLAYLALLEQQGLGHIAEVLVESLAPQAGSLTYGAHYADGRPSGWVQDPDQWGEARRIMTEELLRVLRADVSFARLGDNAEDASVDLADSVRWRRFMERTRGLRISVDGVRVRSAARREGGLVEVSVPVTLTNQTRAFVSGTMAFETLPLAWEADPAEVEVPRIAPGHSRRVTLRAVAGALETNAEGVRYLPITLRTDDGRIRRFSARATFLAATPCGAAPTIDGDLRDWPSVVGNTGADFVLITGESPESPRQSATRPDQVTEFFVAADADAVYLGINCGIADRWSLPSGQRNFVQYEDQVPVGEELVEVLIDPLNMGTRSTSDLFHIVVKPRGWFCERGIGTDPPTGEHGPWAADITAAVEVHGDHWVAELRIPKDAFGPGAADQQVWGLNLTRFNLATQQFSNWSGAIGNVYDPLSLGNLALP